MWRDEWQIRAKLSARQLLGMAALLVSVLIEPSRRGRPGKRSIMKTSIMKTLTAAAIAALIGVFSLSGARAQLLAHPAVSPNPSRPSVPSPTASASADAASGAIATIVKNFTPPAGSGPGDLEDDEK